MTIWQYYMYCSTAVQEDVSVLDGGEGSKGIFLWFKGVYVWNCLAKMSPKIIPIASSWIICDI